MNRKEPAAYDLGVAWAPPLLLVAAVALMYGPAVTTDYLMNDEMYHIGHEYQVWRQVELQFFGYGRALWGLLTWLVYSFVGYDTLRIQVVRFVSLASMAAIAVVLYRFLQRRSGSALLAVLTVLLFFCQPSFQGLCGYSLGVIEGSLPAPWLSLAAFFVTVSVSPKLRLGEATRLVLAFVLLLAAMQATQTYAFFAAVPLSFLVLSGDAADRRRAVRFLVVAVAAFAVSTAVFKLAVDHWVRTGHRAYPLGVDGLAALADAPGQVLRTALDPVTYWSAFRIWSYPFPFHGTPPMAEPVKRALALAAMAAWLLLIGAAVAHELRGAGSAGRRQVLARWSLAAVCLVLGAIFVVADSPLAAANHRPHILVTFAGVCIFSGAYALSVLARAHSVVRSTAASGIGLLLVFLAVIGAQTSFLRGVVLPRKAELDFIRAELGARPPEDYSTVIVALPRPTLVSVNEPHDRWFGTSPHVRRHHACKGRYRYAMHSLGMHPDSKAIVVVEQAPEPVPESALLIDWTKYIVSQRRQLDALRHYRANWSTAGPP